jgi:hypothetical protein
MGKLLKTAQKHFADDLVRARALLVHASAQPAGTLKDDVLRAALMMAVGACDAYFCDVFADVISRVLRAKDLEPKVSIPDRLNSLKVPVVAILSQKVGGWRWRMAARELIEDESVLSLEQIRKLFNQFFGQSNKILNQDTIGTWIEHPNAKSRAFGVTAAKYRAGSNAQKAGHRKSGLDHFEDRFSEIFQRRHDCIHNCDRPKTKPQPIDSVDVDKRIEDIEFLVQRFHDELKLEFPAYLQRLGFSAKTRNQVCM